MAIDRQCIVSSPTRGPIGYIPKRWHLKNKYTNKHDFSILKKSMELKKF